MTLTTSRWLKLLEHSLGGPLDERVPALWLLNQAGHWVITAHPWSWTIRPTAQLELRGEVSIDGGTYTDATLTVTAVGAFTNYDYRAGDRMRLTNALTGFPVDSLVPIASKTDNDNIVLSGTGLGVANDAATVDAKIEIPYALLPDDFSELVAYDATNSLINSLELTDHQHLMELRTNQIEIAAWNFYGAILWFADQTDNNKLKPRLELWPDPPPSTSETLSIIYRAGWVDLTDDNSLVPVPPWMEMVMVQAARAMARGMEEEDEVTLAQRLIDVQASPYWVAAMRHDNQAQPNMGPLRGGGVQSMPSGWNRFLRRTVSGPS